MPKLNNCVEFLQWALPRLGRRWEGYRKVKKQVCQRIRERMEKHGLKGHEQYRQFLESNPEEWALLDEMMRISISRFFRDYKSWELLKEKLLPQLVLKASEENRPVNCWSAGCASGEEPYSLAILWKYEIATDFPEAELQLIATDLDDHLLERANRACYTKGNLKYVPEKWLQECFEKQKREYCLKPSVKNMVEFKKQDIRQEMPPGKFDLVFCKNVVGMYFEKDKAAAIYRNIIERMHPGGYLFSGNHEPVPLEELPWLEEYNRGLNVYRKKAERSSL